MSSRWLWGVGTLIGYGATLFVLYAGPLRGASDDASWRVAHALLYAGWSTVLLALIARVFPRASVHGWRAATLALGAVAAGIGLWLAGDPWRAPVSLDTWMAALLGLALAMLLPRWLPTTATRRWLAIERRHGAR